MNKRQWQLVLSSIVIMITFAIALKVIERPGLVIWGVVDDPNSCPEGTWAEEVDIDKFRCLGLPPKVVTVGGEVVTVNIPEFTPTPRTTTELPEVTAEYPATTVEELFTETTTKEPVISPEPEGMDIFTKLVAFGVFSFAAIAVIGVIWSRR